MTDSPNTTRRTVLAGAFGITAMGGTGLAAGAAAAVADVTIPTTEGTYFLDLTTIAGDVTERGFEGQVALLSWGWGGHSSTDPLAGAGGGVGKSSPEDMIAVAYSGIHSPKVFSTLNTGRTLATVLLSCVKPGTRPFTYLTVSLGAVVVTDYYLTPDVSSGRPLDVVHLKFTRYTQTFTPQLANGAAGTPVTASYDYR